MEVIGKALATIEDVDDDLKYGPHGGFTCIASTPSEDRDGDNLYQEEWKALPEHITVDSDHGMSVATTVGSGRPYFNSDGNIQTDVSLSSIPRAQEVRTLIKERHIRSVSVAFMTDKTKKSGEPRRELLNLGIVAVPSNREAIILDSKALDVRAEEIVAERAAEAEMKAPDVKDSPKPYGDVHYADPSEGKYPIDTVEHIRAALRFIGVAHNRELLGDHLASTEAAIHAAARAHGIDPHSNGKSSEMVETKETKSPAIYVDIVPRFDYDGFAANLKAAMTASGIGGDGALVQAIHDASSHLGAACPVIEVTDEGDGAPDGANKSLELQESETFEKRLDKILTESGSPEAPAPTDMVPAPASPDDDAEIKARAMRMGLGLLTTISN